MTKAAAAAPTAGWRASLQSLVPGLALAALLALAAQTLAPLSGTQLPETVLALTAGLVLGNLVQLPPAVQPGVRYATQTVLRLAIVLIGARLSFGDIASTGLAAVAIVALCIGTAFLLTAAVGMKRMGVAPHLALLIGAGTAICGNSAIMALAPAINAPRKDVTYAVATITFFGTVAVFLYPYLGHLLQLADSSFGVWAGVAVHDTSQVIATAFAFSDRAGETAVIVKLTRNTFMAPVILAAGAYSARLLVDAAPGTAWNTRAVLARSFPLFILGFLAMALLNTAGLIPAAARSLMQEVARFYILMALAGVGLGTSVPALVQTGPRPFLLGLLIAAVIAAVSLGMVLALGL